MIARAKVKNLILIIISLLKAAFTGRANRSPQLPPKSIVVMVLTNNVGDMIFGTSVFRAIKVQYPEAHLAVVGSKKNAITLSGNPDIDTYIAAPKSVWQLVSTLRKLKADYGFTLTTSSFDVATMFMAGVKSIACFNVQNARAHTRSYDLLKILCIQVPYHIGQYVSKEYLRILEPIKIFSNDTKKYLYYNEKVAQQTREKFSAQGVNLATDKIVAILPGAGTKVKQWPSGRFAEVADYLKEEHGFKVAVIGGPGDAEEISLFKSQLKTRDLIDGSLLSLEELIYFISECRLLIANDSGPVYMAEAFNVPTLVVVGPTDEMEHPPYGPRNAVVTPRRDEAPIMRGHIVGYDEKKARQQIEEVSVVDVIEALQKLLHNIN